MAHLHITIDISTNNASFEDDQEIDRILRDVVDKIGNRRTAGILFDNNDNNVGNFQVTETNIDITEL